jgi:hypothetical protein
MSYPQGDSDFDETTGQRSFPPSELADGMTRRRFVKTVVATGVTVGVGTHAFGAETKQGDMLYRTLGKTGEKVSAIGLGGFHIGVPKDENEGIRIIRTAIDRGITFMDNCWD